MNMPLATYPVYSGTGSSGTGSSGTDFSDTDVLVNDLLVHNCKRMRIPAPYYIIVLTPRGSL